MGVRVLEGTADGTTAAACMYDSVSGQVFGPIFEANDAADQVEAFLDWLRLERYVALAAAIGLTSSEIPDPREDATDARNWPVAGLSKLVAYWRRTRAKDETGSLRVV